MEVIESITGKSTEFNQPEEIMSTGEGREIVRTQTQGFVNVVFQIGKKDFELYGYTN